MIDNFSLAKEKKRSFCHVYFQISSPLSTRANDGKISTIKREISRRDLSFLIEIKKLSRIKVSDPRGNRSRRTTKLREISRRQRSADS